MTISPKNVLVSLALLGAAGLFAFQELRHRDSMRDTRANERRLDGLVKALSVQTDDAFARIAVYRDSIRTQGRRVDTVVVTLRSLADTMRATTVGTDSVTLPSATVLGWAHQLDYAVNEIARYRLQVDSLLGQVARTERAFAMYRASADSLLAIKDARIKDARKRGWKEGVVVGGGLVIIGWIIIK